jgi:hypothetical protein
VSELIVSCLMTIVVVGCNSLPKTSNIDPSSPNAQIYLAGGVGNLKTYTIDHTANTFVVTSYSFTGGANTGGTVNYSGTIGAGNLPPKLANGIYDLNITYYQGQTLGAPPLTGNWLIEMPGEAALTALETTNSTGTVTSFAPLAPTNSCPSYSSSQAFQFVTIPEKLSTKPAVTAGGWNPKLETAYGSVSVTTNGNNVQFANISQFILPSANGGTTQALINPAGSSTATGACSATFYGQAISYPPSSTVTNPGGSPPNPQSNPPSATIAISPSGFLLEDAGSPSGALGGAVPPYQNLLGAAYGAIGLPKPASALATSDVVAAQYQGILYGAASGSSGAINGSGFRLIGSFGYSDLTAAACAADLPAPSGTIIYGGEFASNNPSANAFGNCDLAIDLGTQDASNNGLYSSATVYVSANFPNNRQGSPYSFGAVAIAGQIKGKYAIFLIGADTTQPWGIYLLQSN